MLLAISVQSCSTPPSYVTDVKKRKTDPGESSQQDSPDEENEQATDGGKSGEESDKVDQMQESQCECNTQDLHIVEISAIHIIV